MKKLFLFSIFSAVFFHVHGQIVSLKDAELEKLKTLIGANADVKNHWLGLLKTADEALTAEPNPADTILSEGILQGDPRKTKTWKSLEDMQKVYALGLAYKVTSSAKYLDKASEFLLAWAKRNQPQGNPINDTNLDRIIFTYDLLKTELKPPVVSAVKSWLSLVAKQEIKTFDQAVSNKRSGKSFNNWNSHRIKAISQVAAALEDTALLQYAMERYKAQISSNLKSDGSSFDFHERDALHYHVYDVDPLLVVAMILTRATLPTKNFYTYQSKEGNSLKKSIAWLLPYFSGEKTHAEWVNSKSAFDKKRADNGEKGYIAGTLFNPSAARTSIALADYFESGMLRAYQQQAETESKYPSWQFVLNEVKK
ncbi:alginate lyase family protein [Pedobacter insulae]|uniref:Alginate lyase n=1 Tax=Pedobacter insulae TaxID=414048 RepID=A0A1I2SVE8_9SPHI|nr:alginate lyase family protein [Pedobacter insulae]SFG56875.1 Alginate lyase [Pedobacter insulae]